jgi:glutamate/tyrosine decarboxylase-like PLP-dependent enzyme
MDWNFLKGMEFPQLDLDNVELEILNELSEKLQDNYPYNRAEYAGQMIKPPHPLAQAAYWMTSFVNPNNHALDGGKATSALEMECIRDLGNFLGYENPLGHLTSGGTMANLEALWVARQSQGIGVVLANELAHYTHSRMAEVLGLQFQSIPATVEGTIDLIELEKQLKFYQQSSIPVTIVATMGTTGMGRIDPLHLILDLARLYNARVHADAAYGGYFKGCQGFPEATKAAFNALGEAHSIAIDPHKHGLQPYGCGAVLFKNPLEGRFYKHDSPYTYFTSKELHLGEITLECSRPGASAAALWATMRRFPLTERGNFFQRLEHSLDAAKGLTQTLIQQGYYTIEPSLDIAIFSEKGASASEISRKNQALFLAKEKEGIHLALFQLNRAQCTWELEWDQPTLTVLRSVLMKPEHNSPSLWEKIARQP